MNEQVNIEALKGFRVYGILILVYILFMTFFPYKKIDEKYRKVTVALLIIGFLILLFVSKPHYDSFAESGIYN